MVKLRVLAFIVFIAVAVISYLTRQPIAQIEPNAPPGGTSAIAAGWVFYHSDDPPCSYDDPACDWREEDKIHLWSYAEQQVVASGAVLQNPILETYGYSITAYDLPYGNYRLLPDIKLASTNGVSPAYKDIWWQGNTAFQDWCVNSCVQQ